MSKWLPDVDDHDGADAALKGGFYGSLGFAAMLVLGIAILMSGGTLPVSGTEVDGTTGALIGILAELVLVLITAWRFRAGKGLIWGSIILIIFAMEIVGKVTSGTTNVGWIIFYAAVGMGLVNGLRGAWAKRHLPPDGDCAEAFE